MSSRRVIPHSNFPPYSDNPENDLELSGLGEPNVCRGVYRDEEREIETPVQMKGKEVNNCPKCRHHEANNVGESTADEATNEPSPLVEHPEHDLRGNGETLLQTVKEHDDNVVWLLKSIMPLSQGSQLKEKVQFAIHGHWAACIRGYVYELQQIDGYATMLWQGRGSDTELFITPLQKYLEDRGADTIQWQRIGTARWCQKHIKKAGTYYKQGFDYLLKTRLINI